MSVAVHGGGLFALRSPHFSAKSPYSELILLPDDSVAPLPDLPRKKSICGLWNQGSSHPVTRTAYKLAIWGFRWLPYLLPICLSHLGDVKASPRHSGPNVGTTGESCWATPRMHWLFFPGRFAAPLCARWSLLLSASSISMKRSTRQSLRSDREWIYWGLDNYILLVTAEINMSATGPNPDLDRAVQWERRAELPPESLEVACRSLALSLWCFTVLSPLFPIGGSLSRQLWKCY